MKNNEINIGDILYPINNPDTKWYKRDFWDILVERRVTEHSDYKKFKRFKNYECAIIFSELIKLKNKIERRSKK